MSSLEVAIRRALEKAGPGADAAQRARIYQSARNALENGLRQQQISEPRLISEQRRQLEAAIHRIERDARLDYMEYEAKERAAREEAEREERRRQDEEHAAEMRQRAEQAREAAERDAELRRRRDEVDRERVARELEYEAAQRALRERIAAREQAAREQALRERQAQEEAERREEDERRAAEERLAAEVAAQEAAERDAEARRQALAEAAREQAAREQAAREQAAREQAAQEQAARERRAKEQAAQEEAARKQAAREQAAREEAERERAASEQAAREEEQRRRQAEREEAARLEAAKDAAQRADAQQAEDESARRAQDEAERLEAELAQAELDGGDLSITPESDYFSERARSAPEIEHDSAGPREPVFDIVPEVEPRDERRAPSFDVEAPEPAYAAEDERAPVAATIELPPERAVKPRRRSRWKARAFALVTLAAFAGAGWWWVESTGLMIPAAVRGGAVPNPPPTADAEDFDGAKQLKSLSRQGGFGEEWTTLYDPGKAGDATAGSAATAKVGRGGSGSYLEFTSNEPGIAGSVSIELPQSVIGTLQGKTSNIALVLEGGEKPVQVTVECEFGGLGNCGRHRFLLTQNKSDLMFDVKVKADGAPDGPGRLVINADAGGEANTAKLFSIHVLPGS